MKIELGHKPLWDLRFLGVDESVVPKRCKNLHDGFATLCIDYGSTGW
jgi:hypothetical protein